MNKIELIARGVCVKSGKILLCKNKNKTYFYLPGGHIEHRERAEDALLREIREELGLEASILRFLGCAEFCYKQKIRRVAEVNLVFEIAIPRARTSRKPGAKEKHLTFFWQPLASLASSDLQPEVLRTLLPQWRQYPGFSSSGEGWIESENQTRADPSPSAPSMALICASEVSPWTVCETAKM